ncbi:MAG TPA: sulfur oxidation c-type cytochrome SoxA [Gammaproteobacteria bacterium]
MKKLLITAAAAMLLGGLGVAVQAGPQEDLKEYRAFFTKKFPNVKMADFADGAYAIDEQLRANWLQIEEFPPYEPYIAEGEELFNKPFKNGKTYASCFPNKGIGIADRYPHWDKKKGQVVTLESAIQDCRKANGEEPLKGSSGPIASIEAYMAFTSRGKKTNVVVPMDDPKALEAYNKGKEFYFTRRGQLNFSCAHCHFGNSGMLLRTERLSPALGQTTHFPKYRSKWGAMGTLNRRFKGCNRQVRASPFKDQSEEYRNLEFFLTHMSNGIPLNGPGARK